MSVSSEVCRVWGLLMEIPGQAEDSARSAVMASKAEGALAASLGAAAVEEVLEAETRKVWSFNSQLCPGT